MRRIRDILFFIFSLLFSLTGCRGGSSKSVVGGDTFSGDSAYQYVSEQVAFGPRIPDSDAHARCMEYILSKLRGWGYTTVAVQHGTANNYANRLQAVYNITAKYLVDSTERKPGVLLVAHYDTRPWADAEEDDYEARFEAFDGANDGASGVGVLLELARQLSLHGCQRNVYFLFTDVEDMGTPSFYAEQPLEDTWCLGSQWYAYTLADNPQTNIEYGILLDMVGDHNARFLKEYFSYKYSEPYVERLWHTAQALGFTQYFPDAFGEPVVDDHKYLYERGGIPCVDVIHTPFPEYWHTRGDNMGNIDKHTLAVVGEVVLAVITN